MLVRVVYLRTFRVELIVPKRTEVYFYRNDLYPFVRAKLKEHDLVLHNLLEEICGPMK